MLFVDGQQMGDETMDFRIVKKNAQMSRYIMGMGQNSNLNHKF